MRGNFFFALLFFLGNCSAEPALPESLRQVIDDGIQSGALRGVAAGWMEGPQRATAFFGAAHADTTFEIGAATEVFTSLLLAQAVIEGKVRMQAPLKQLLPDVIGRGFDLLEPREVTALEKWDRRHSREVGHRGLRVVNTLAAQEDGQTVIDAVLCGTCVSAAHRGHPGVQRILELPELGLHELLCALEGGA